MKDRFGRIWKVLEFRNLSEGVKVEWYHNDGTHLIGWVTYNDIRLLLNGEISNTDVKVCWREEV